MNPPWLTKLAFVYLKEREGRWKYIGPSEANGSVVLRLSNTDRVINAEWDDILPEFACAECGEPRNKNDYICDGCRKSL